MSDFQELIQQIIEFRSRRDWKQFHTPKDLAISLALETSEVLEYFQWKSEGQIKETIKSKKEELGDELADVLYYLLLLSFEFDIDLKQAFIRKMKKNANKYPVEKAKGKNLKYNEL